MTEWSGRRVWIVGASSGIGAALARQLHERGARLALSARRRDALQNMSAGWPDTQIIPLDVTDAGAIAAAARHLAALWGGIDLVVLGAGIYQPMRGWEIDLVAARCMFDVNVMGVIHGTAAALPTLLAQGQGAIAIIASVAGYRGLPKALIYGASKSALISFCESLFVDLRPRGIGVHLVCPGFVATPLTRDNDFEMPALITPEQAADEIIRGLARGAFEIHFPRRFTLLLKLLELLPYTWYFALTRRMAGKA